jgi:hypothetical protein
LFNFYKGYNYYTDKIQALQFLYPNKFETENLHKRAILCSTNNICDEWNSLIQNMNPNPKHELLASNIIDEVDDPHGIISSMLNDNTLSYWDKPGVPAHKLELKVGDICFLLRTLSKKNQLSRNTRVKIHSISRYFY